MIKRITKRFLSLLLVTVMVLTLVPVITVPVHAATSGPVTGLADEKNIGLSFSGDADDAWSASGTQIVGSATGKGGTCGATHYESTLTITNKRATKATLSFDYAIEQNSGTIQVGGDKVSEGGKFSRELAPNTSIKVYIKSGSTSAATKITMTNVALVVNVTATVTFQPAENGSYTVDGKAITEAYINTQSSMNAYQVAATPAAGYQFMGWYNVTEGKYINTSSKAALNIESDCTITARFTSKELTLFEAGGQVFDDLNEAVAYAQANGQSKITLASDGSISGTYTIPTGITLLIPFDAAGTLYTDAPAAIRTAPASKPFRTLTMSEGTSITVNGAISLGGRYFAAGGSEQGRPVGDYGYIKMADNSSITVKNGGNLYAWGFISGSGSVLAESGATVYEFYQIADFRGGTASSGMGNKVFPFSQYFIQNIEVPLTLNAGANEKVFSGVYAMETTYTTSINFIGNNGMFKVISGSFTKDYDEKTDRLILTVNGKAELNTLALKLAGMSVNSASYVLPITNNISINIQSGKVTINQDTALLAGVEVSIAEGADLTVSGEKNVYVYDGDEWNSDNFVWGPCKFKSVAYAPGKAYNRTNADLKDAKVDVNGSLTAIGAIYTTKGGADICSSEGTGKYVQQGTPGTATETYQYNANKKAVTIPITAAKLHNADGSYTETETAKAGTTIKYYKTVNYGVWHEHEVVPVTTGAKAPTCTEPGCTGETICTACEKKVGSNMDIPALGHSWDEGVVEIEPTCTVTGVRKFTCKVCSESKTEVIRELGHDWGDWTVTTPATCTEKGKKTRTCTRCHETDMADIPATGHTKELRNEVKPTLTTPGYSGDEYCSVCQKLLKKGTVIPKTGATFTFDANGGEGEMEVQTSEKNTANPLNPNTFTRVGYTFDGWNTQADGQGTTYADGASVNFDKDTTLYAQWKINQYTITFDTDGGTSIAPITQDYGTSITKPADPTKTGYTFAGWESEIPGTMPAKDLTIKAKWTVNKYTVTWKNWDGTVLKTEENVLYGTIPEYNGETPTKVGDAQYTYTFKGWSPKIVAVTGDTEYTAVFEQIVNTYTVTWKNWDGSLIYAEEADYGTVPKYKDETPKKASDAQYSYEFAGWTPEIAVVTGDVTYTATFRETVKTYTVTWVNWDGALIYAEEVSYGTKPEYKGDTPERASNAQYTYTFANWTPEIVPVTEDTTYTATFTAKARVYTVTWKNWDGSLIYAEEADYGTAPKYKDEMPEKASDAQYSYKFAGWTPEIAAVTGDVTYTATFDPIKNGWFTDETGRQYYKDGELQKSGWTDIGGETYYLNLETGYAATGIVTLTPVGAVEDARCVFDDVGVFQKDVTGVYTVGTDTYWLNSGIIEEEAGLKRVVKENGEVNYYYFAVQKNLEEREGLTLSAAVKASVLNGQDCWLHKTNGLALPEWGYYFDENGVILHDEDTSKNGVHQDGDALYYYVDGIKAPAGMVKIGDDYYYAKSKGELVVSKTYYCSRMNGLMEEGTYAFDAEGKLIPGATDKNGIVKDDDGVLRYYVYGKLTYAGLIELEGNFYYVNSKCEVVNSCVYPITWTHGLKEAGYYKFDEMGKMIGTPKNGIVRDDDGVLRYYVNDKLTYAGLIKIGEDFYYVNSKYEVVHDCDYTITWTHDLKPQGKYHFDADGKLTGEVAPLKNGIYEEDGSLYFYRNGERAYAGLIQIDGDYYYVRSTCEVVHDCRYYVYWTHDLLPMGYYTFDSAGRMIPDGETE